MRSHLKLRKQEKVDLIKHHVLRRKLGMIAEKLSITSNQSKNQKKKQANITDDKSIKDDTEDDDEMIGDTVTLTKKMMRFLTILMIAEMRMTIQMKIQMKEWS